MHFQRWLRRLGFRICCTCCGACALLGLSAPYAAPLIWNEPGNPRNGPLDVSAILILIAGLLASTLLFLLFFLLATLLAPPKQPVPVRRIQRRPQRRQQYRARLARFLNLAEATLLNECERGTSRMPFWMRVTNLIRRGPKSPARIRQLLLQIHHTVRPSGE